MASDLALAYIKGVESRLAADGCNPRWQNWGSTPVLVGRRADFRLSGIATRLPLFTLIGAVDEVSSHPVRTANLYFPQW
jgi:hypothetical protein